MNKKEAVKNICELIEKGALNPKCEKCGEPLSPYAYYDEQYEIRKCKKCGKVNRRKRVDVR